MKTATLSILKRLLQKGLIAGGREPQPVQRKRSLLERQAWNLGQAAATAVGKRVKDQERFDEEAQRHERAMGTKEVSLEEQKVPSSNVRIFLARDVAANYRRLEALRGPERLPL